MRHFLSRFAVVSFFVLCFVSCSTTQISNGVISIHLSAFKEENYRQLDAAADKTVCISGALSLYVDGVSFFLHPEEIGETVFLYPARVLTDIDFFELMPEGGNPQVFFSIVCGDLINKTTNRCKRLDCRKYKLLNSRIIARELETPPRTGGP
ncbi:MAG: hypothetical protein AAGL69_16575 [Pseudomonadota bacterium]